MTKADSLPGGEGEVEVHLLGPDGAGVVKTWRFANQSQITIGRASDRDVEIPDGYVSREHATISLLQGEWVLTSQGRNGVLVNNRPVDSSPLGSTVIFRLGANGPLLKFCQQVDENASLRTLSWNTPLPLFPLDGARVQAEVDQISTGSFFQSLQSRAEQMRRKRSQ
jgi:pSer/pThr/pTyr-binding forkhead associated (FHA) protein